jgi:MFS family permease
MGHLTPRRAVAVFAAFAFTYLFAAVLRAVTATLSPVLTAEFSLQASDLGLLAGGYFLGFAAMQLPLGTWLDRHGPKKVILAFLAVAVLGCIAFSWAQGMSSLLMARILCGVGVSACLMAPLTGYRRWFAPQTQLRANSWMLMAGSLGMVASTLPVQWLLPVFGWRPLFWLVALGIVLAMAVLALAVPRWDEAQPGAATPVDGGYREVWRHPYFRRMVPIGFFSYGGMIAIQALWAGPWMVQVEGRTPAQSAAGLFSINLSMLFAFWLWGLVNPSLARRGLHTDRLIAWGLPLSFVVLACIIGLGAQAGALWWAMFCVSSTFVSLAQPAVGMAFAPQWAGRALAGYNLVVFSGVFTMQWGIGLCIDAALWAGASVADAYRFAMAVFLALSVASYGWFLARPADGNRDNGAASRS